MVGLVVSEDGMRPTCELRQVIGSGGVLGIQQKWINGDATFAEWRWLPVIGYEAYCDDYVQTLRAKKVADAL